MNTKKMNFKILIPVWGKDYIDLFCHAGLCSLMSSGNISSLAKRGNLKICFLTSKNSEKIFIDNAWFIKLKDYGEIVFSFIDDLLDIPFYGILLTKAYERGILEEGPDRILNTYFIFLNADFVLSGGSFDTLLKYIDGGSNAVVAPSLRCMVDVPVQKLKDGFMQSRPWQPSSRELVQLCLTNLHSTVFSQVVNQNMFCNEIAHQFYWNVDSNTLIGRFFLMFMLCIKPERIFKKSSGYCDYSFIPDLCPSGNYSIIEDSDELFILELSKKDQEIAHIKFGKKSPRQFSDWLSTWTTKEHRDYSKRTILFHSENVSESVLDAKKNLDSFMGEIYQFLKPPLSHINHHFWVHPMQFLEKNKDREFQSEAEEKTLLLLEKKESHLKKMIRKMYYIFFGKPPFVRWFHPDWLDYHVSCKILKKLKNKTKILYIRDFKNAFDNFFSEGKIDYKKISLNSFLMRNNNFNIEEFQAFFVHITPENLHNLLNTMEFIPKNKKIIIFINGLINVPDGVRFSDVMPLLMSFSTNLEDCSVAGGSSKILLRSAILQNLENIRNSKMTHKPYYVIKLGFHIIIMFLVCNLWKSSYKTINNLFPCSSIMLIVNNY